MLLRRVFLSRSITVLLAAAALLAWSRSAATAAPFTSRFDQTPDRIWIGSEYWANPMEDWRVHQGRLECVRGGENRNVHLLTHWVQDASGGWEMSVRLGMLGNATREGSAGFAIGVRDSDTDDHLSSLFFGDGMAAGITADGRLFVGRLPGPQVAPTVPAVDDVQLHLSVQPAGDAFTVTLTARNPETGETWGAVSVQGVPAERLAGNLVLVNNHAGNRRPHVAGEGRLARFWFRDWTVRGADIVSDPDQAFGPILYAMHTLSRGVLKMTAQMPPIGAEDSQTVRLQIQTDDDWRTLAQQPIDPLSRTATFRIADWQDDRDVPYRLVWTGRTRGGLEQDHFFTGTVRRDPREQDELVIAGFTGNTDSGFPNRLVAGNVAVLDPDVLFFSGDQIYESVGGYGIFREPVELAAVNYLRKIIMWGWAFRDVMRDRPTLVLPDDHDVYQGNIWGQGGRDCGGMANHAQGGYAMPAAWVNAVQRTQTAHHPDAFDPAPVEQGITVYYGDMVYGRVSFAVLEDRKFKSGPEGKVDTWPGRPDHVKDPNVDPRVLDKPGLQLLGDRQLEFLRLWAADWKGADMKLAVSQTIFCNLANYHGGNQEYLIADLDSNGWPQGGRNRALEELRRGFAFHYAGDQHLPSIVHHGVDTWRDAGYSFCVPSIAAGYPRSWRPDTEGRPVRNRPEPGLANTGDYLDGLGNHVTVHAIGNPADKNRPGRINTLHDKSSGFGIVRMNKAQSTIKIECYRLQIDAADLKPEDQFPGWPKTIRLTDNYAREPAAHLPQLRVNGLDNPVVQVLDQATGEIVYTLRIRGTTFQPKVFNADATYTVRVSEPDTGQQQVLRDIQPQTDGQQKTLDVTFAQESAARHQRPNILLIVADNLGYGDLSCYGCPDIRTPNIDRLATQGVRFTNFYSNGPECSPTRTALLTGRYQQRVGGLECALGSGNVGRYDDAIRLAEQGQLGLPPEQSTLIHALKAAGYRAVGLGKWHLGYEPHFLPPRHGFDYFLASLGGTIDYFYHNEPDGTPVLYENERPVRRDGYFTDLITDGAVTFLRGQPREEPFLLYLPYTAPSAPLQHPDIKPDRPKVSTAWDSSDWQVGTRDVLRLMIQRLDQGVGRVLQALDETGRAGNTLVIFCSDNGAYPIAASNAPFRGHASELFEGGIHVACMARWPGVLPRGAVDDRPVMTFDLTASILAAAGVAAPAERPLDGVDVLGQIAAGRPPAPRVLYWRARRANRTWRAVREGDWKYVSRTDDEGFSEWLFDLSQDPGETENLLANAPADAERLKQLLIAWEREVQPARNRPGS
jgi:arylsulfatase A-like enzyme